MAQDRADSRGDAGARADSAGIARGDRASLERFYRDWFDWTFRLARTLTGRDESFCLDVVQDAMLRVARSMRAMRGQADLERWMTRVVHTTALDQLRRESRRLMRERARGVAEQATDGADLGERIELVRRKLRELAPDDGWLVWLRVGRGRTLADAGAAAGIGEQAAHGRIRRALARLRAGGEA